MPQFSVMFLPVALCRLHRPISVSIRLRHCKMLWTVRPGVVAISVFGGQIPRVVCVCVLYTERADKIGPVWEFYWLILEIEFRAPWHLCGPGDFGSTCLVPSPNNGSKPVWGRVRVSKTSSPRGRLGQKSTPLVGAKKARGVLVDGGGPPRIPRGILFNETYGQL